MTETLEKIKHEIDSIKEFSIDYVSKETTEICYELGYMLYIAMEHAKVPEDEIRSIAKNTPRNELVKKLLPIIFDEIIKNERNKFKN